MGRDCSQFISFTTIIKNEEKSLKRMLDSVKWCDEHIIVDNGSTDNSVNIAKRFGCEVITDKTRNNLSYLRNLGLEECRGDWIFSLDGDEYIEHTSVKKIKNLATKHREGYSFVCRMPREADIYHKWHDGYVDIEWGTRLFRNLNWIRYSGYIHEMVDPSIDYNGGTRQACGIPFMHNKSFEKGEPRKRFELEKNKNNKLPEFQNAVCHHFRLGRDYLWLDRNYKKAHEHFDEAIKLQKTKWKANRHQYMYFMKGLIYREEGKLGDAYTYFSMAINDAPRYAGAYYMRGLIADALGFYKQADKDFKRAYCLEPEHPTYKAILEQVVKMQPSLEELPILTEGIS